MIHVLIAGISLLLPMTPAGLNVNASLFYQEEEESPVRMHVLFYPHDDIIPSFVS